MVSNSWNRSKVSSVAWNNEQAVSLVPHSSCALMWKELETAKVSSGWAGLAEKAVLNNNTIIVHLVCRRITDSLARFRSSLARRSNSSKGKRRENIWRTDYSFSFRSFIRLAFSVDNHSVLTSKFFQLIFSPLSKTRLYLAPTKMALI